MKQKFFYLVALFAIFCTTAQAQSVDDELMYWINSGDFLQLRQRYNEEKNNISSPAIKLLADAYLKTAFNRPAEAVKAFHTIANGQQEALGLDGINACTFQIAENLRYLGEYKLSADLIQNYVEQADKIKGMNDDIRKYLLQQCPLGGFGNKMAPEIIRPGHDCEVPIVENPREKSPRHPIYINVSIDGKERPFIFDTGCDGYATNLVSEKFARQNGITILKDSVVLQGMGSGYAKLGTLPSMKIGELEYRNVAFAIVPGDNILPGDSQHADAALGLAFIKAVGECRIYPKEKKIVFPAQETPTPEGGSNMMLKNGQPYIEAYTGEERLLMHFDTGAAMGLSNKFFEEHQEDIEANGTLKKDQTVSGFGGTVKMDKYTLKNFPVKVNGYDKQITEIDVMTAEGGVLSENDGLLGASFINLFDKVTINFTNMFVKFE